MIYSTLYLRELYYLDVMWSCLISLPLFIDLKCYIVSFDCIKNITCLGMMFHNCTFPSYRITFTNWYFISIQWSTYDTLKLLETKLISCLAIWAISAPPNVKSMIYADTESFDSQYISFLHYARCFKIVPIIYRSKNSYAKRTDINTTVRNHFTGNKSFTHGFNG